MKPFRTLFAVILIAGGILNAFGAATVGQPAPDFSLTGLGGAKHSLSDYRGSTVILEWVNPGCPFVRKHYEVTHNLPETQKAARADGVIWLTINSGHPGAQGDLDDAELAAWIEKTGYAGAAYLRDQEGVVGRLYNARTTPHLFIINPQGTLVYAGGIDDIASLDPDDIRKATNYVLAALAELKAGKPITHAVTRPYGCSVKYAKPKR